MRYGYLCCQALYSGEIVAVFLVGNTGMNQQSVAHHSVSIAAHFTSSTFVLCIYRLLVEGGEREKEKKMGERWTRLIQKPSTPNAVTSGHSGQRLTKQCELTLFVSFQTPPPSSNLPSHNDVRINWCTNALQCGSMGTCMHA